MEVKTIGLLSAGEMGHAVGEVLVSHGLKVVTCLKGRSEQTRSRARRARIEDIPTLRELVKEADLFLSIVPPARALETAHHVAEAISETGANLLYADCNAVAPQTVSEIETTMKGVGVPLIDVSIIGAPPSREPTTRFYVSGPDVEAFKALVPCGLHVILLGDRIGKASAFKMCYAALTKGMTALATELLVAGRIFDILPALEEEFRSSEPVIFDYFERKVLAMPKKSGRFVGEMEEIAKTFERLKLTPAMLLGAAEIYRFVSQSGMDVDDPSLRKDLNRMVSALAEALGGGPGG